MSNEEDKYSKYVEHPRYGRGPRYSGLNPDPMAADVLLNWNSTAHSEIAQRFKVLTGEEWPYTNLVGNTSEIKRIPNTAIAADLTRQSAATVPVTHYFDLDRICRECRRSFIFFAEEQRYWYEELHFRLDSDCVRCVQCRKGQQVISRNQQLISRNKQRYEELVHIAGRSTDENFELADCCLSLIEGSVFTSKRLQLVRTVLNRLLSLPDETVASRCAEMKARVKSIEAKLGQQNDPSKRS